MTINFYFILKNGNNVNKIRKKKQFQTKTGPFRRIGEAPLPLLICVDLAQKHTNTHTKRGRERQTDKERQKEFIY